MHKGLGKGSVRVEGPLWDAAGCPLRSRIVPASYPPLPAEIAASGLEGAVQSCSFTMQLGKLGPRRLDFKSGTLLFSCIPGSQQKGSKELAGVTFLNVPL